MKVETRLPEVLVLLPTGRDARVVCDVLEEKGVPARACEDVEVLLARLGPDCGPLIVGEEALHAGGRDRLTAALEAQPDWSDLPVVLLRGREPDRRRLEGLAGRPAVNVVSRPLAVPALVGLVRSSWENRRRQFAVRDLLRAEEALRSLNKSLETRVRERTALAETRSRQLRSLALELIAAEDRERERIALLLHDDLQQHLATVKLKLDIISLPEGGRRESDEPLRHCVELLSEAIRKTRRLSHDLSPPLLRRSGLLPCLDGLLGEIGKAHGLNLKLCCSDDAEPESRPVAAFLYQALKELLFNVVKHSGANTARVDLRENDGWIVMRVADSGDGADLAQVYARRGVEPGFGLFSIEERVQSIGGRMTIDTAPGEGWATTLAVPKAGAEDETGPEERRAGGETAPARTDAPGGEERPIRIVIADDHDVMREGLAGLLDDQKGMRVVGQAGNGREAVALVGERRPDLVLMDVSMPVMDGIAATEKIAAAHPEVVVVGLSMHDEPATRQSMLDAGAREFLCKTHSPQTIVETVRRCAAIRPFAGTRN